MNIDRLIQLLLATIAIGIGLSEAVMASNVVIEYPRQVAFASLYQKMEFAPQSQQWRAIDSSIVAHASVLGAILAHILAAIPILLGSIGLIRARERDQVRTGVGLITVGLLVAIAFNIIYFLLIGTWLRILYAETNVMPGAIIYATLYIVFAIVFAVFLRLWRAKDDA